MAKPDIHPTWYPEAKVICNGEVVMTVGSTQPEINVEVWSGNHPFYTGTQKIIDTEGRVDRFQKRYAMIGKKKPEKSTQGRCFGKIADKTALLTQQSFCWVVVYF
ncbi:50S ribosomal protein L31 [Crocosphaera subtropica ATCC 51142]|uniref:Large ribosomal subunit protein bL31 n=1 Tax=Crocosphaera subtropica (strain ATCC 51142 / BH68) TaxID=43989 RepID=B1WQU0_CROS5|nr:50S ribosomal protein L31 [Crocosphaera subtropica ATCC 51142]